MGYLSLVNNSRSNNTAIGSRALLLNTTAGANTAIGRQSLEANTTGSFNTASGFQALRANTTGGSNTASGYQALGVNTTGYSNTASGYQALGRNTIGVWNTASGNRALVANTSGYDNTANGLLALGFNTTGSENTASGYLALYENTTGTGNTAIGYEALRSNSTGNYNTAFGRGAGPNVGGLSNTTCVGFDAQATQSNEIRLGNNDITRFSCKVGLTVSSDRNLKENFLPVDGAEVLDKIKEMPMTSWNYIGHDANTQRHYGPMAQDFYAAFGTDAMGTIGSPTTVNTNDMAGVTFSAIQQLTKENEDYKQQLQTLKEEIDQIRQQIGRGSN